MVLKLIFVEHQILNIKSMNSVNLFVQNGFCSINNFKLDTKSFLEKSND